NFSTEDLVGVLSSGQQNRGRGNAGGPRGGSGNQQRGGGNYSYGGNNAQKFLVNKQKGIAKKNSFGLNYADLWKKPLNHDSLDFRTNMVKDSTHTNDSLRLMRYISNQGHQGNQYNQGLDFTGSYFLNNSTTGAVNNTFRQYVLASDSGL